MSRGLSFLRYLSPHVGKHLRSQLRSPGFTHQQIFSIKIIYHETHLFSCSKQGSHTRTSFSMPNLGMVEYLDEHFPQKICPQARQWCWKKHNKDQHTLHTNCFHWTKKTIKSLSALLGIKTSLPFLSWLQTELCTCGNPLHQPNLGPAWSRRHIIWWHNKPTALLFSKINYRANALYKTSNMQ